MLTVELPKEAEAMLVEMAKSTGHTVDQIVRKAVLDSLEDWEDARIAEERLVGDAGENIPLEEVVRKLERREAEERRKKPAAE